MSSLTSFRYYLKFDYIFSFFLLVFLFSLPITEGLKQISLSLLILMFLFQVFKKTIKIEIDIINVLLLFHLLFVLVGIFIGVNIDESLDQCRDTLRIVLVFFIFRYLDLSKIKLKWILNSIYLSFIIAVSWAFFNYFSTDLNFIKLNSVGSANRSAVFISIVFVLSLSLFFIKNNDKNIFYLITLIFSSLAIVFSGSRMVMFTFPLLIIFILYLFNNLHKKSLLYVIGIITLLVIMALIFGDNFYILNKFSKGFSDIHRIQLWLSSIYIWYEHNWLFGIGVGNSIFFNPQNYFPSSVMTYIDNAHNTYLDMLLERGILGLLTYLGFIYFILVKLISLKNNYKLIRGYFNIGIALWVMNFIMSFANITFRYEFALLMVAIWGLLLNKSFRNENILKL